MYEQAHTCIYIIHIQHIYTHFIFQSINKSSMWTNLSGQFILPEQLYWDLNWYQWHSPCQTRFLLSQEFVAFIYPSQVGVCTSLYKNKISRWLLVHLLRVVLEDACLLGRLSTQAASSSTGHSWLLADISAWCRFAKKALTSQDNLDREGFHTWVWTLCCLLVGNIHLLHWVQMETLSVSLTDHCSKIFEI